MFLDKKRAWHLGNQVDSDKLLESWRIKRCASLYSVKTEILIAQVQWSVMVRRCALGNSVESSR